MKHYFTRNLTRRNSLEKVHNHFSSNTSYVAKQVFFISNTFSSWDQGQIGNKTCYIPKVSKLYAEKGYLC